MPERVLVFDLVGTLLDLSALDQLFDAEFGSSRIRSEWFQEALKIAFAMTAADSYQPFADITKAALKVIEARYRRNLSWIQRRRILSSMRELPAFEDVKPALHRLAKDGHRMAVLTNSSQGMANAVLKRAGILPYFEQVFSADNTKRLKPANAPYMYAAKHLKTKPKKVTMIAAHSWDIFGAHSAGMQTCFVGRPEQSLNELTPKPDLVVSDMMEMADRLNKRGL